VESYRAPALRNRPVQFTAGAVLAPGHTQHACLTARDLLVSAVHDEASQRMQQRTADRG
jgi:hypothetical protein